MTNKHLWPLLLTACTAATGDVVHDDPEPVSPQPAPAAALGVDLDARIAAAGAIVHGTIARLDYRVPDTGPLAGVPRTQVTLVVDTALAHARRGETITLEFLGGVTRTGRVVIASEMPLFDVGDEVVWFVGSDRASGCPLVDCGTGVIRISGGTAYDEGGHALFLDGDVLRRGPREDIPEAGEFRIGSQTFRRAGDVGSDIDRVDAPLTRAQLLGWLTSRIK